MSNGFPKKFLLLPLAGMGLFSLPGLGQEFIQLGAGYQSEDSFKMGEYNGLTEKQMFGVSAFLVERRDAYNADTAKYWRFSGSNLGLDIRRLDATIGDQGKWGVGLSWQELPHYRFDNPVSTPFRGAGTARQTLPTNWTGASSTSGLTVLNTSLQDFAIRTDREKLSMTLDWQLDTAWSFTGEYRHETKKGNDTLGAIFGSNGGNPRGAILAAPVDYSTDIFNLGLSRQYARGQTSLFYRASLFNNDNRSLQWDNPFDNNAWAAGAGFSDGAVGEMALAPDNRYWQTGINSVYRLGDSARLSGNLSVGRMLQDESFLPYSNVFTAAIPLPVTSLNGKVDTLNALLNYSIRLGRSSSLRLRYSLDERDNNTQVHLFQRIPGDAAGQGGLLSSNARLNRPYSFRNQRFTTDADYRLSANNRLSFGYELEDKQRNRVDVERTREHTGHVKLGFARIFQGRGSLQYSQARRTPSAYVGNQGFLSGHNPDFINTLAGDELYENDPLLRRFNLAERNREQLSANFNLAPTDILSLDVIGKLTRDDFPTSRIGVQNTANRHLTINLNIDASADWHAYTYITAEQYRNRQQGYSRRGGGNPTPALPESARLQGNNWWVESQDNVISTGLGISWTLLQEKLDLNLDLNHSDAQTETSPNSIGQAWMPLADIDSTRTSFSLKGSYAMNGGNRIDLRYRYEKFSSSDFAFDNVAVDTLNNVILLGNTSPDYSGHIIELAFVYTLPGNQE